MAPVDDAGWSADGGFSSDAGQSDGQSDAGLSAALCAEEPSDDTNRSFRRHLLRFVNEDDSDPSVEVTLTRDYIEAGVGESAIYALERMSLTLQGLDVCVTDPAALDYANTHHNWFDDAIVEVDGIIYTLKMQLVTGGWEDVLTGENAAGDVVFGPAALVENSGVVHR
ncbi:MAG: hypothetical protein GY822_21790 [Deltaproteobacteria bacterium]|nr:hypothetical protein [Deltaproteobacteria bacterium]